MSPAANVAILAASLLYLSFLLLPAWAALRDGRFLLAILAAASGVSILGGPGIYALHGAIWNLSHRPSIPVRATWSRRLTAFAVVTSGACIAASVGGLVIDDWLRFPGWGWDVACHAVHFLPWCIAVLGAIYVTDSILRP